MKNSKKTKTALNVCVIISVFVAMIIAIIASTAYTLDGYNYLYTNYGAVSEADPGKLCVDWNYAGIFVALLVVALILFIVKFAMFTIPTIRGRSDSACITLICEILVFVGLVFTLIGLFLPEGVKVLDSIDAGNKKIIAATISGWTGTPLAFIASLGTIGLNRSTKK